jgi:hypothetical protein
MGGAGKQFVCMVMDLCVSDLATRLGLRADRKADSKGITASDQFPISLPEKKFIVAQMCQLVLKLNQSGICHRDFRIENGK